jgi:release factor glutamine methyltransferase
VDVAQLAMELASAGFVAADEEAAELTACAGGDEKRLKSLVERRLQGEPLAWITGNTTFCGLELHVDKGVYVPRWQSEQLAQRALDRLPVNGIAVDLCAGAGAIARVLQTRCPTARVLATDVDEKAVSCARSNHVDAYLGDLFSPLPNELQRTVDVIVAVVPYVPTPALPLLPRDTLTFESPLSYDGGDDGTRILRRVIDESPQWLRSNGSLLLELGGEQAVLLEDDLRQARFTDITTFADDDGDVRGVEATYCP